MYKSIRQFAILFLMGLCFISCNDKSKSDPSFSEDVNIIYEDRIAVDSKLFGLKYWVTDEETFNGKPTIRLDSTHKYGLSGIVKNLKPDAFVRVTVWKKGNVGGNLALTSDSFKIYRRIIIEHGDNGWNKILLEGFISPNFNGEKVKVFAMNFSKEAAYFYDLEVTVYNYKPYPAYNNESTVEFIIKDKDIDYINKKRIKSFERGVITKKTKKEFDATAIINGKEYPVTMRIKGDWLDHIQGNKWSFRVKMKEGNFRGMKEFSVQQPGARGYLSEWVMHKIFEHEDVLTPRYGFVPVKVNGSSVGIYAYEEHFEKRLVESKKRREGPILKFDESAMWNITQANIKKNSDYVSAPLVESTIITPFKKKKTMQSDVLRLQFLIGQNLLNQYRNDENPVSELFKTDQFSKFYAITDIAGVWHPVRWHNERFYYDPISSKLEVIAYDCYSKIKNKETGSWLNPGLIYSSKSYIYDKYLGVSPFNDTIFLRHYLKNMQAYLNTNKLLKIIEDHNDEIIKYEEWINREYAFYHYEYHSFEESIKNLKPKFKKLEKKLSNRPLNAKLKLKNYNYGKNGVIEGFALQGFTSSTGKILVKNFHSKPLVLIGYSSKKRPEQGITYFEKPLRFKAYKNLSEIDRKEIKCFYSPDKIYFKENNDTLVYTVKVMPWPEPGHTSPRQELMKKALGNTTDFADVNDETIIFKPGKHTLTKPIIIPPGKKVIINNKTHLDFVENAFFISFSPVQIIGTPSDKVFIESSDGTGMGFTIIESENRSSIKYARFKGWNTLNYQGWTLTGAVTFYESDVTIEHTEFLDNNCEDALNIIRADFLLKESIIANAYADGFDADFTTGVVYDCDFKQIGNDGIDYSGSEINIENVRIDGAGDKGISGGEGSTLHIKNSVISNSNIGIASKDDSNLNIENISLINCNCGFAAYQKKTEYGPAEMTIKGCEMKNVGDVYMLGLESVINLDGDVNIGAVKLNVDSLYMK